jgi:hypothetical protein
MGRVAPEPRPESDVAGRTARQLLEDILAARPVSDRKLRLFAVAYCLECRHARPGKESPLPDYLETLEHADDPTRPLPQRWGPGERWPLRPREWALQACANGYRRPSAKRVRGGPSMEYLVQEIIGPDSQGPLPDSLRSWNGGTAFALAKVAYEDIDETGRLKGARLLVLSDALEEAGLTDAELLAHLRAPGPHYRGCHVLDAVLGKA